MMAPKTVGTTGNSGKRALLPWTCSSSLRASLFWPGGSFGTCGCAFAHIQSCGCQLAAYCRRDLTNTPASVQRHRGSHKGWVWYEWQEQERFLFVKGCHPLLCSIQFDPDSRQWYFEDSVPDCNFPVPRWEAVCPELGDAAAPWGATTLSVSCGSKLLARHTLIKTCF